jgi:phage recombination protein Bet
VTELAIVTNNTPEPHQPAGGALELRAGQTQWTPDQHAALTQLGLADATEADLKVLMHQSQRTGLDPFSRQIYMIGRKDRDAPGGIKWTIQTGIDGFRIIADRRPEYRGQVGPEWCGDDGVWRDVWVSAKHPAAARVGVLRSDFDQPIYGVAMSREYAQHKYGGELTAMWSGKGALMIAKCAEALALRKAFPHDLSGLVTDDEMARDDRRTAAPSRAPAGADAVTIGELTGTDPTVAPDAPEDQPDDGGDQPVTRAQLTKLHAQLNDFGIKERGDKLATVSALMGRELGSSSELSVAEASGVIDLLERLLDDDEPAKALDAAIAAIQDTEQGDSPGENS